jgi:hypothetical protein
VGDSFGLGRGRERWEELLRGAEGRLGWALYRDGGELAREICAGKVVASRSRAGCPGWAGYRRWGRGWRLDLMRPGTIGERLLEGRWRRVVRPIRIVGVAVTGVSRKQG